MRRSKELNRMTTVLSGADSGFYTLPAAVAEARAAFERLADAESPCPPVNLGSVEQALADALLAAADSGSPWPMPDPVVEARAASEAADVWSNAHSFAVEAAEARLVGSIVGRADQVITEHLRPAILECLADARAVSKDFEAVASFDDKALLAAEPKYRNAALRLDAVSIRYRACRDAQSRLTVGLQNDLDNVFFELSNLREVYGSSWPGRSQSNWSPFPTNGRQRMAYLVSGLPKVVTWTASERDAAWTAEFGPGRPGGMGALTPGSADLLGRDVTPVMPHHSNRLRPAGI